MVLVVGVLAGLVPGPGGSGPGAVTDDPGVVHVHGLGVNPADGALYAATHTGLFRVDRDGTADRVADRYQDTMGFTVVGPDRFLASGHPDLRSGELRVEGRPPLLGLVESADAGRSWRARALLGEADLHTIVAAGDRMVAYDSADERVLASIDAGRTWETRSRLALVDLAAAPGDLDRMAGIGIDGSLLASSDGGRSWTSPGAAPAGATVLRWVGTGLWAGGQDGTLHRGNPASATWEPVRRFDGPVEALVVDGADVYVAVDGSGIYRTGDSGRRWELLYRAAG